MSYISHTSLLHDIFFQILTDDTPCGVYHQTSNISGTIVGNKIVDHSDVVGASAVGAAPTTSSFLVSMDSAKTIARRDKKHLSFGIWCGLY